MRADLREDGWWLIFDGGEEAGPFRRLDEAQAFLDLVDNLQRQQHQQDETNPFTPGRSAPAE